MDMEVAHEGAEIDGGKHDGWHAWPWWLWSSRNEVGRLSLEKRNVKLMPIYSAEKKEERMEESGGEGLLGTEG